MLKKNFIHRKLLCCILFVTTNSFAQTTMQESNEAMIVAAETKEKEDAKTTLQTRNKKTQEDLSITERLKRESHKGSFEFGPSVSFGFFNFFSLGVETRLWEFLGFSANLGGLKNYDIRNISFVKKSLEKDSRAKVESTSLSITHFEGRFVVYPFLGSFFVGAAAGLRSINAKATVKVTDPLFVGHLNGEVKGWAQYITPQIGWMGVWGPGFMIGTELGVQIPVHHKLQTVTVAASDVTTGTIPNFETSTYASDVRDFTNKVEDYLLKKPLPFWNILKIGWMF